MCSPVRDGWSAKAAMLLKSIKFALIVWLTNGEVSHGKFIGWEDALRLMRQLNLISIILNDLSRLYIYILGFLKSDCSLLHLLYLWRRLSELWFNRHVNRLCECICKGSKYAYLFTLYSIVRRTWLVLQGHSLGERISSVSATLGVLLRCIPAL